MRPSSYGGYLFHSWLLLLMLQQLKHVCNNSDREEEKQSHVRKRKVRGQNLYITTSDIKRWSRTLYESAFFCSVLTRSRHIKSLFIYLLFIFPIILPRYRGYNKTQRRPYYYMDGAPIFIFENMTYI